MKIFLMFVILGLYAWLMLWLVALERKYDRYNHYCDLYRKHYKQPCPHNFSAFLMIEREDENLWPRISR